MAWQAHLCEHVLACLAHGDEVLQTLDWNKPLGPWDRLGRLG